jgi:hypothetical protein
MRLLTTSNTKTLKGEGAGFLTLILHLAPAKLSGYNVCPMATKGCAAACLNTAGRGKFSSIQAARIRKTRRFFLDRAGFMADLAHDIAAGARQAKRKGLTLAVRLNGTSDIRWELMPVGTFRNIFEMFPGVTFYDYTKIPNRRNLPANYSLTFSRAEQGPDAIRQIVEGGQNVAAVFRVPRGEELPLLWEGLPVIDGDTNDLRFTDPRGVVVGLRAKGDAARDRSGFVLEPTA